MIALLLFGLASPSKIVVDPSQVLNRLSPAMYGSCIEDVNHEIYGGLYAQQIFGESFEEPAFTVGPAGWRAFGGAWTSDGKTIQAAAGDGPKLVLEHKEFTDGLVSAKVLVRGTRDGNAGLLVRVSRAGIGADNFDGYEVSIDAKAHRLVLGKHQHDFHLLQQVPAPVQTDEWHKLRVALKGPRIRVFINDETKPRIDYSDSNQPLLSGGITLRTWQVGASFSNLSVAGEPISLSLNDSGVSGTWDPVGTGKFSLESSAFNGSQCQKIVHGAGQNRVGVSNRGLNRWGIAVHKGRSMEGRVYVRGDVVSAMVALQSANGTRTYATQRISVGVGWTKASFKLTPSATDPNARFSILLDKPGSLYVDQTVILSSDRFKGLPIRGDIARALVNEKLTFLRYGGTMVNVPGYRWKNMIGNPDRRPPYRGNWYPHSTNGFGIFDFLNFCEAAHFQAAFAINAEETPEDAADLADYLTAPVNTQWGRRRALDGHPVPYRPAYIEIGNEEAIGETNHANLAHYAERFKIVAKAIHSRNPNLKLVCAAWWVHDSPDMKLVFDAVDDIATAWDFHFWSDDANAGAAIDKDLARAESLFKSWNPKTNLKVVIFEENGNLHNLQRALGHATTLNAARRHGNFVIADCAANCLQPWQQNDNGWDQGQLFFNPSKVWGMPPYDAHRILSDDALPLNVATKVEGDLDVLATKSEDGKTLVLTVVNFGPQTNPTSISLGNYQPQSIRATTLMGKLEAVKFTGIRSTVATKTKSILWGRDFKYNFPAHSMTSLRFTR